MNTPSYRDIFDHLASLGLLSDKDRDQAEQKVLTSADSGNSASRLIAIVAGIGAWLTMIFLVLFLAAIELIDWGDFSSIVVAVVLGAAAIGAYRNDLGRGVFASQLILATSFTTQVVAFVGVGDLDFGPRMVSAFAFCTMMYVFVDSRANQLFSAAFFGGWFVVETGLRGPEFLFTLFFSVAVALPCVVFGARRWLPSRVRVALRPAAYVAAVLALGMSFEVLGEVVAEWLPMAERIILAVAATVMLALALLESKVQVPDDQVSRELNPADVDQPDVPDGHRFIWAAVAVVALGLFTTPGVLCSALIVGLGLWRRRIWLAVLGAIGLTAHLSVYYYQLDMTLLAKSGVLVASGLILLALRWILDREAPSLPNTEAL